MPTLNLDLDYFDHPKTKRLIGLLGKGSEVLPLRLWCYVGKHHPESGRLIGYSTQEIESIVRWWGQKGHAVSALVRVKFLHKVADGYEVHDWGDHEGHLLAFKIRGQKAALARWSRMASNASSMPQACNKQSPEHFSSEHTTTGDKVDSRIRQFIGAHASLIYSPVAHSNVRKMVESGGWNGMSEAIDEAIANGAGEPTSYALKVMTNAQAKIRIKAKNKRAVGVREDN